MVTGATQKKQESRQRQQLFELIRAGNTGKLRAVLAGPGLALAGGVECMRDGSGLLHEAAKLGRKELVALLLQALLCFVWWCGEECA